MTSTPTTYSLLDLNMLLPLFQHGTGVPWSRRVGLLAKVVVGSGAHIVTAQECGKAEAADLAHHLGSAWHYQRNGNNTVLWSAPWSLVGTGSRDFDLPSGPQMARTLLVVKLRHTDSSYVWAGSTHFAAHAFDLSVPDAVNLRHKQAALVGKILANYHWLLVGIDTNSHDDPRLPRAVLRAAGFTMLGDAVAIDGIHYDRKHGIDEVATKAGVVVIRASVVRTGEASDHDGRLVTFTIKPGQTPVPVA